MTDQGAYARAGVDIAAGQRATELMKAAVQATYTPAVLAGIGSFGGLFSLEQIGHMADPVLVASTDGVGTKTRVAARFNRWESIGHDIVNHCVNDILVQGAQPLFFLDYVASGKLHPEQIATIVRGIAGACQAAGCALLGGETAEMPGIYVEGEIDLVGTIVGVVDRAHIIDGSRIEEGDVLIGLPSSGLHTNGYTLARSVLANESWLDAHPQLQRQTIGDVLLSPHRSYLPQINRLRESDIDIRGLAHITGGGLIDNVPRILPDGIDARFVHGNWPIPPIFNLIQSLGHIEAAEMFRVFNMGLGMVVVVPADQASLVVRTLGDNAFIVGGTTAGEGIVTFQ